MHFKTTLFATAIMLSSISAVNAATIIDHSSSWDTVNKGWSGSGQSLTVDAIDNTLDSIGFYFAHASAGKTFNFSLSDALTGGTTFFSTSVVINAGLNTINIGTSLLAGSTIYALFDYAGFTGQTAYFNTAGNYAGGQSFFHSSGRWSDFQTDADHRFIAEFSSVSAVPIPAAAFLFAPALLGFMGLRRKAKIAVA